MKIMIRCDVEGVTGVTRFSETTPGGAQYAYAVEMLHHDVIAVVDGLLAVGRHELWIYDMHCEGINFDLSRLDPHVRVVTGKPPYRPGALGGLTADFDGQVLVGLHSKAGAGELLSHTYEHDIADIMIGNTSVGEIGMEAALAAELGVPTIMVTGDSAGCKEARTLIGPMVTVEVKESAGPQSAVCFPTSDTGPRLRQGAQTAMEKVDEVALFKVRKPISIGMRFVEGSFADHVRGKLSAAVQGDGTLKIKGDTLSAAWAKYLDARP